MRLRNAIDSNTAMVGDALEATLENAILERGVVIVPKGALVTGRLRRLEKQHDSWDYFVVALEFDDVESPGHHARFFGSFKSMDPSVSAFRWFLTAGTLSERGNSAGKEYLTTKESLRVPEVPGVATFLMEGSSFRLREGTRLAWETREIK